MAFDPTTAVAEPKSRFDPSTAKPMHRFDPSTAHPVEQDTPATTPSNSPTVNVYSDTLLRFGKSASEGMGVAGAGIVRLANKVVPKAFQDWLGETLEAHGAPKQATNEEAATAVKAWSQDLAHQYETGLFGAANPIDESRDYSIENPLTNLSAGVAELAGGLAPIMASGPLGPMVIATQYAEGQREKAVERQDSPEEIERSYNTALPFGLAMGVVGSYGGKTGWGVVKRVLTRSTTGAAGAGALSAAGDVAQGQPINLQEARDNALMMGVLSGIHGLSKNKKATVGEKVDAAAKEQNIPREEVLENVVKEAERCTVAISRG